MVKIVYLPKKGSNMPERVSIRWDGVDYSLSAKKPIKIEEEIAKAILGDWEKEGILLSAEIARVKAKIAPSTPLHQIFVVVDNNYKNIFQKEKIFFEEKEKIFFEEENILKEEKNILEEQKNILEEERDILKKQENILKEEKDILKNHLKKNKVESQKLPVKKKKIMTNKENND